MSYVKRAIETLEINPENLNQKRIQILENDWNLEHLASQMPFFILSPQTHFIRYELMWSDVKNIISKMPEKISMSSYGCSVGSDAYLLGMIGKDEGKDVEVTGFDIHPQLIQIAKQGIIPFEIAIDPRNSVRQERIESFGSTKNYVISAARDCLGMNIEDYIGMEDDKIEMKRDLLQRTSFIKQDLTVPFKQEPQDLIVSLQVLYLLSEKGKTKVLENAYKNLRKGGILVLSAQDDEDAEVIQRVIPEGFAQHKPEPHTWFCQKET